MMHRRSVLSRARSASFVVAVAALVADAAYQSPSTLVSQFTTLFGANKYARLVWQRNADGASVTPNSYESSGANEIMRMDTRDGNPVVLIVKTTGGYKSDATFTWDGKRIVYYNNSASEIRIVNWDGTNDRVIIKGYNGSGHCWRSSAGKDYVLACNMTGSEDVNTGSTIGRKLFRINVDDTLDKTLILTTTWAATLAEEGNAGTYWVSMSADGKHIVGGFPTYSMISTADLDANGQATTIRRPLQHSQGCWPTMARDNTGDVLMTIGEHTQVATTTYDDVQTAIWDCPVAILGTATGQYESLRWTPDRNFMTMIRCCGSGKPGPYVVRYSDKQFVYLNSSLTVVEGNMDVYFYTCPSEYCVSSDVAFRQARALHVNQNLTARKSRMLLDCRGRLVTNSASSRPGVYVAASATGSSLVTSRIAKEIAQ